METWLAEAITLFQNFQESYLVAMKYLAPISVGWGKNKKRDENFLSSFYRDEILKHEIRIPSLKAVKFLVETHLGLGALKYGWGIE